MRNKDKPLFDDQCRHAFGLKQQAHLRWTRDISRVNWEEFVCLQVRENGTYSEDKHQFRDRNRDVRMKIQSLISGGPLFSLRCSARVHHCLSSLVRVVDWCVSRLVRLICCQIILTASSPWKLLIYCSLVIHLLVLPPLRLGRLR